jgi:uncharacterized protein
MTLMALVVRGVPDVRSQRVAVGFNWTAVETATAIGFAATPSRSDGAKTTTDTGTYAGRSLAELAMLALSNNPYERAIGVAAANAHWNTQAPDLSDGDGLTTADPAGTVVIGRFPGLDRKLPGAIVLERNPGPGDLPASDAPRVIPTCSDLIITATTLINGTIEGLLALAGPSTRVTIVGPGTPLCPALFDQGVHRLAGFVALDRGAAFQAVMEGAGARGFRQFGRAVVRAAPPPPGQVRFR